jgi:hypothetical protein
MYALSSLLTTVPHKHLIIKRKFGQMALKVTGNRVAELLLPGPAIPIICTSSRSAWHFEGVGPVDCQILHGKTAAT